MISDFKTISVPFLKVLFRLKLVHTDFITHIATTSVCTEYLFQMIYLSQFFQHTLFLFCRDQQISFSAGRTFLFDMPHAVIQIEVDTIETHLRIRIDQTFRNIRIDSFGQMLV